MDYENLPKAELNRLLITPLSDNQLKKTSREGLVAKLRAQHAVTNVKKKANAVLVKPGKEVKEPRAGTKREALLRLLQRGTTIDEICIALGWAKSAASSAIYLDVKLCGYGVERREGKLWLMMPLEVAA